MHGSPLATVLPRRLWQAPAGAGWGPLPELLLALTLVTGLVDAVSILALGRVFVANMTGNVVFAGFAITGAPGFSLGASLFALGGFLVGAALGGRMTAKVGHDHALHLRIATASEFALVAVALIVAAASGGAAATHGTLHLAAGAATFDAGIVYAVAALLAVAMGIQNAVARKLAVPDLTTTVLTMTLTGIGHDARSGRRGHVTLALRRCKAWSWPTFAVIRPPRNAPTRKPASANRDAPRENPGAPVIAKPAKTTFPVMFATKTRPSARIDTASTMPVTTVRISSSSGSGPQGSPAGVCQSRRGSTRPSGEPESGGLTPCLVSSAVFIGPPVSGAGRVAPRPLLTPPVWGLDHRSVQHK